MRRIWILLNTLLLCFGCSTVAHEDASSTSLYHMEEASQENVLESIAVCYGYWFHEEEEQRELSLQELYQNYPELSALSKKGELEVVYLLQIRYQSMLGEAFSLLLHQEDGDIHVYIRSTNEPEIKAMLDKKPQLLQQDMIWRQRMAEQVSFSFFQGNFYYEISGKQEAGSTIIELLESLWNIKIA